MRHQLTAEEASALSWLNSQSGPVYSFNPKTDPSISTIRALIKKRLAKVQKVIPHPNNPAIKASAFRITRKGKRYNTRLEGIVF